MQGQNKGQNGKGTRSKLCWSPGGVERMLKVWSVEHGVRCTENVRQQHRGKDLASTYVLHPCRGTSCP